MRERQTLPSRTSADAQRLSESGFSVLADFQDCAVKSGDSRNHANPDFDDPRDADAYGVARVGACALSQVRAQFVLDAVMTAVYAAAYAQPLIASSTRERQTLPSRTSADAQRLSESGFSVLAESQDYAVKSGDSRNHANPDSDDPCDADAYGVARVGACALSQVRAQFVLDAVITAVYAAAYVQPLIASSTRERQPLPSRTSADAQRLSESVFSVLADFQDCGMKILRFPESRKS